MVIRVSFELHKTPDEVLDMPVQHLYMLAQTIAQRDKLIDAHNH